MGRYTKYSSNYRHYARHQTLSDGSIVKERDFVTIGEHRWLPKGKKPYYNDTNFIFTLNSVVTNNKKYKFGEWDGVWSLDDVANKPISPINNVKVNTLSNDLGDFAYYGSASELVRGSVYNIVSNFPARITTRSTELNLWKYLLYDVDINDEDYEDYLTKDCVEEIVYDSDDEEQQEEQKQQFINTYDRDGDNQVTPEERYNINYQKRDFILDCGGYRITKTVELDNTYYILRNDFGINIHEQFVTLTEDENPMRYMCHSAKKYQISLDNRQTWYDISKFEIVPLDEEEYFEFDTVCLEKNNGRLFHKIKFTLESQDKDENGTSTSTKELEIRGYYKDGDFVFATTEQYVTIQPKQVYIDKFFNELDDFESLLLRRDTKPLYTNEFKYYYETAEGYKMAYMTFSWPKESDYFPSDDPENSDGFYADSYCICVNNPSYENYISSLVEIANRYDELWTDNLYRSMTHEAIKNYDWSYTKEFAQGNEDDYIDGGERTSAVLRIYGRIFDDLKRNIDGISMSSNITYDGLNNCTEAETSDKLELQGWEVYTTIPTVVETEEDAETGETTEKTIDISDNTITFEAFNGVDDENKPYVSKRDNIQYTWYIKKIDEDTGELITDVNYHNIPTYHDTWYGVTNYTDITERQCDLDFMKRLMLSSNTIWQTKGTKHSIDMIFGMFGLGEKDYTVVEEYSTIEPLDFDENFDGIADINRNKTVEGTTGDEIDPFKGIPLGSIYLGNKHYIVPFFEDKKRYDGEFYFQSKGGWGKKITSEDDDSQDNDDDFVCDRKRYNYMETQSYLGVVPSVGDLLNVNSFSVKYGDIFYVISIADYIDYDESITEDENVSHFFALVNEEFPEMISSWIQIDTTLSEDEIESLPNDGEHDIQEFTRYAKYLDKMVSVNVNNNPHVGFGNYDCGSEFEEYMSQPFNYAIENYEFGDDSYLDAARDVNFSINTTKTINSYDYPLSYSKQVTEGDDGQQDTVEIITHYPFDETQYNEEDKSYSEISEEDYIALNLNIKCSQKTDNAYPIDNKDMDGQEESEEETITYYLNSKRLIIKNNIDNDMYKKYFFDVVFQYLMQVIPSTTILYLKDFD